MKSPQVEKYLRELLPSRINMEFGFCVICRKEIDGFNDDLSEREYYISGLCQECQDVVFNEED